MGRPRKQTNVEPQARRRSGRIAKRSQLSKTVPKHSTIKADFEPPTKLTTGNFNAMRYIAWKKQQMRNALEGRREHENLIKEGNLEKDTRSAGSHHSRSKKLRQFNKVWLKAVKRMASREPIRPDAKDGNQFPDDDTWENSSIEGDGAEPVQEATSSFMPPGSPPSKTPFTPNITNDNVQITPRTPPRHPRDNDGVNGPAHSSTPERPPYSPISPFTMPDNLPRPHLEAQRAADPRHAAAIPKPSAFTIWKSEKTTPYRSPGSSSPSHALVLDTVNKEVVAAADTTPIVAKEGHHDPEEESQSKKEPQQNGDEISEHKAEEVPELRTEEGLEEVSVEEIDANAAPEVAPFLPTGSRERPIEIDLSSEEGWGGNDLDAEGCSQIQEFNEDEVVHTRINGNLDSVAPDLDSQERPIGIDSLVELHLERFHEQQVEQGRENVDPFLPAIVAPALAILRERPLSTAEQFARPSMQGRSRFAMLLAEVRRERQGFAEILQREKALRR